MKAHRQQRRATAARASRINVGADVKADIARLLRAAQSSPAAGAWRGRSPAASRSPRWACPLEQKLGVVVFRSGRAELTSFQTFAPKVPKSPDKNAPHPYWRGHATFFGNSRSW